MPNEKTPGDKKNFPPIPSDHYEVLGVANTATENEISRAFKRLARRYHPDVNPGDHAAAAWFRAINDAQEILRDSEKRKQYDNSDPFGFRERARRTRERAETERLRDERNAAARKEEVEKQARKKAERKRQYEEEAKKRQEESDRRHEERERLRAEAAQREAEEKKKVEIKREVGVIESKLRFLQNSLVNFARDRLKAKYRKVYSLVFRSDQIPEGDNSREEEVRQESENLILKLAEVSGELLEAVRSRYEIALQEKVKREEMRELALWKNLLNRDIQIAQNEIFNLGQDLSGGPTGKGTRAWSARAIHRSWAQNFLRRQGLWPGLKKVREEISATREKVSKLETGVKEIERVISALQ